MSEMELVNRLERLERSHRRLKGFTIAALALATALATIYATEPAPHIITAHEFHVVNDSGNVRVLMSAIANLPAIRLYDGKGIEKAEMVVTSEDGLPIIGLSDANGGERLQVSIQPGGSPEIMLLDPTSKVSDIKQSVHIGVDPSGSPTIKLSDAAGFVTVLGRTGKLNSKTGATEQTSAASIVISDNEHNIIWKAP